MRKILGMAIVLMLTAGFASAQISGTAHNFSAAGWNDTGELCKPCHTPHNGDTTVTAAPLWNHTLSTVTNYSVYSTSTLDATVGQPGAISKACLSCHDGTVALASFGGNGSTSTATISGTALLSTDLSNDHPVGFAYTSSLATTDGELHNPATTNSGLGSTIQNDMLFSDALECASCHDPHGVVGVTKLLLKSNASSALCLTCHNK